MQKLNTTCKLNAFLRLMVLTQSIIFYQGCKGGNVLRQEYGIVEQFLVAFITEDSGLPFVTPRASVKYPFGLCPLTVSRATK